MNTENKLTDLFPLNGQIPETVKLPQQIHQKRILINGVLIDWDGPAHDVYSPVYTKSNEQDELSPYLLGSYPLATYKEAELAIDAAVEAYKGGTGAWPTMHVRERIQHVKNFLAMMRSKRDEIVGLILWEIGKSASDAQKEFDRTVEYIEETIRAVKTLHNNTSSFAVQQQFIGQTKKVPYGVVLCMGPFNYPLNETFTTLIPALIMGNTVLFKPPKHGTLLFEPLLEAFATSFPKGVINTIYGRGRNVVPALMESGKVDVLALIGPSRVADSLKKMHPKTNRLKSVLGLDAKNAAIVLEDTDIELAVRESIAGALSFNGQRCTALKILFVHESIAGQFNKRLTEEVEKLVIGMPWTKNVNITPLAEPDKPGYLKACIEDAKAYGASILNEDSGGGSISKSLVQPAIVYPVNKKMRLYHEEQFGPVIPVVPFTQLQEPIDFITESPYGQQVSIFSQDSTAISALIDKLAGQVGRININTQCQRSPDTFAFNGRKDSADGTLSIEDALLAFSVDSVVATKQSQSNENILHKILTENTSSRLNNTVAF